MEEVKRRPDIGDIFGEKMANNEETREEKGKKEGSKKETEEEM